MKNLKLLFVKDLNKATSEIKKHKGHVLQVFNANVIVAMLNDNFNISQLKHAQLNPYKKLDAETQLLVDAWHHRSSAKKQPEKRHKTDGLSWDHPGYGFPRNADSDPELAKAAESFTSSNSAYMRGSVGGGVWIIQGPTSNPQFDSSEITNVVSSVHEGLNFWAASDP